MIKITIQNTETGEKMMAEVDAFVLATVENMGSANETIYTAMGNVGNGVMDVEELTDAILDRVLDENVEQFYDALELADAMGLDVEDLIDMCVCNGEDCVECCCCPCCGEQ